MIYVYAPSYNILVKVLQRYEIEILTIITYNSSIIKFCEKSGIAYEIFPLLNNTKFKSLLNHKNQIKKLITKYKNCKIIFGHNSFDYWGLYFLLSIKKNKNAEILYLPEIFNHSKTKLFNILKNKSGRRLFIDKIILFYVTKIKFDILQFNKNFFLGIDRNRLPKIFNQFEKNIDENIYNKNKIQILNYYKIPEIKYLLVDQGEEFYEYDKELVNFFIEFNSKEKIYLKNHPNFKLKNESLKNNLISIPDEIPAEILITNKTLVISITSSCLKMTNKKISLIYLLIKEIDQLNTFLKILADDKNILFPKTIKELKSYMIQYFDL